MTYTGNLDQIKRLLSEDGLERTPATSIQTGDVAYREGQDGITIRMAVDEGFGTDDLEAVLEDTYLDASSERESSKRYTLRNAGLEDPSGFYVDDIIGGFTSRIEDRQDQDHIRLDFQDYEPREAIEEAYRIATRLDDDNPV